MAIMSPSRDIIYPDTIPSPVILVYSLDQEKEGEEHSAILTVNDARDSFGNKVRYGRCLSLERYSSFHTRSRSGSAVPNDNYIG